jgi:uncharacterized protein YecT (DUF1311 family)
VADAAPAPDVGPIFVPETLVPVVAPNEPAEREPLALPAAPAPRPAGSSPVVTPPVVTPPRPPEPVLPPPPSAPHPAFGSAERRGRRARRRWWPAAAAVVALLLVAALVLGTRHPDRPLSGDRGLDSLLTAANSADGVVLVDSGQRARTRVEAGGTVDLAPAGGSRCRSAASADQRACLLAAVQRNDAPLNAAYQALLTDLRKRLTGDAERQAVASLRDEQRAWLDDRDRGCRAAAPESTNQLWGVARAPCFAQRSAKRTAELRARIGK